MKIQYFYFKEKFVVLISKINKVFQAMEYLNKL